MGLKRFDFYAGRYDQHTQRIELGEMFEDEDGLYVLHHEVESLQQQLETAEEEYTKSQEAMWERACRAEHGVAQLLKELYEYHSMLPDPMSFEEFCEDKVGKPYAAMSFIADLHPQVKALVEAVEEHKNAREAKGVSPDHGDYDRIFRAEAAMDEALAPFQQNQKPGETE